MRQSLTLFAVLAAGLVSVPALAAAPTLAEAVASPTRTPANAARDRYRHPAETLAFFGVKPGDTVIEIWPGGGWYTEILAPYLSDGGTLYAAGTEPWVKGVRKLQQDDPARFGAVRFASFPAKAGETRVPDGSADLVLTFRNIHNWRMGYQSADGKDYGPEAFRQIYAMLKPGGVLGIEDHRLPESADTAREESSGYIKVSTVRRLAEAAGFRFAGASEVNANPKDTTDWPKGVWTLPPSLGGDPTLKDKYLAIGESDRMTLKFVKPQ